MSYVHKFKNQYIDFIINYTLKDSITPLKKEINIDGEIKYDTGSDLTIFPASQIGFGNISEIDFINWLKKNEKAYLIEHGKKISNCIYCFSCGGVDSSSSSIRSYAYQVDNLTLELDNGSLDLQSVPITITFDKRFINPLFGRDLIGLLMTTVDTNNNCLILDYNAMFKSINHKAIDAFYMLKNGYYKSKNLISDKTLEKFKEEISKVKPTYSELEEENNKLKEQIEMLREYNRSLLIRNKTTK